MKAKNEKRKLSPLLIKLIIGAVIGVSFGFGVGKLVKSNNDLASTIAKNLQQNCNCERVESEGGAMGIQFSKSIGFSNSVMEFTLENYTLTTSAEKEARRLYSILEKDIHNYDSIDLIIFNFQLEDENETVKIKGGRILKSEKI